MTTAENNFLTTDTALASYLITEGFSLLNIQYDNMGNGKPRGTYVFEDSPKLKAAEKVYLTNDVKINLATYERVRSGLLERVKRALP